MKRSGASRFMKKRRLLMKKQLRFDARQTGARNHEHELTRKRFKIASQRVGRATHMFNLHGRTLSVTAQTKKQRAPHFHQVWNVPIAKAGFVADRSSKRRQTLRGFSTFDKHRHIV